MTLPINIIDGKKGTKVKAGVTSLGQLITAPFAYDETKFNELAENDTAYNFYTPKTGEQFVLTGVMAYGDQQITANADANVTVYEASSSSTATVDKVLLQFAIGRSISFIATPLNILVNAGKYINAKTDDDDVHMTITGYYIPKIS